MPIPWLRLCKPNPAILNPRIPLAWSQYLRRNLRRSRLERLSFQFQLSTFTTTTVLGFLNLDKPTGMTSHDCVARVRRLLHLKRVGHGGTLDPMATGVLPIALGPATRLLRFLPAAKAYRARFRLGMTTTTDDICGEVLTTTAAADLTLETVQQALSQFQGVISQIPPNYSAIQVQGKRLYDLARQGKEIAVEPRRVEVSGIEILDWQPGEFPELGLEISCGPGTYIRAIARDLGNALGCGGTLIALTRTVSCGLDLKDSLRFEQLETQIQAQSFITIPAEQPLQYLPEMVLEPELARRWCLGQKVAQELEVNSDPGSAEESKAKILRVHDQSGQFLGIGELVAPLLVAKVVITPGGT